jgi:hypothetical protein
MLKYLSFEMCKPTNESRYITIFLKDDIYYMETSTGIQGIYLVEDGKLYRCSLNAIEWLSRMIEPLKIYGWPKFIPSDYVPGNHMMGCDSNSWTLDYKEIDKKTARHIHGYGAFPSVEPYSEFMKQLIRVMPDDEFAEWFLDRKN